MNIGEWELQNVFVRLKPLHQTGYVATVLNWVVSNAPDDTPINLRVVGMLEEQVNQTPNRHETVGCLVKFATRHTLYQRQETIGKLWEITKQYIYPQLLSGNEAQEFVTLQYYDQTDLTRRLMLATIPKDGSVSDGVSIGGRLVDYHRMSERVEVYLRLASTCGEQVVLDAIREHRSRLGMPPFELLNFGEV